MSRSTVCTLLGSRLFLGLVVSSVAGCADSHDPNADTGDVSFDSGIADANDPALADTAWVDASTAPAAPSCGGVECAPGQVCCTLDLRCVAPGDPSCAPPPGSPSGSCASNADCPIDQSCQVLDARGNPLAARCGGLGTCWRFEGSCGGGEGVCACDGHTYTNPCEAYAGRARIVALSPCGTPVQRGADSCLGAFTCVHATCDPEMGICIREDVLYSCAHDADCPTGQTCCLERGLCVAPGDDGLCLPVPDGAIIGCANDRDCDRYDGEWWGGGHGAQMFCDGPSCDGPGGCVFPPGSCEGVLAPVCGCDGRTYQNACEAASSQVRVAHDGSC